MDEIRRSRSRRRRPGTPGETHPSGSGSGSGGASTRCRGSRQRQLRTPERARHSGRGSISTGTYSRRRSQGQRALNRRLFSSLFYTTEVVDHLSTMYDDMDHHQWQRTMFGHTFSVTRSMKDCDDDVRKTIVQTFGSWLRAHEEAQVMMASLLIVVGIWWLVKAVLALVFNLICPLMVVLIALVCVPQLREPLVGRNYPVLASLLRKILIKLVETIGPESRTVLQ